MHISKPIRHVLYLPPPLLVATSLVVATRPQLGQWSLAFFLLAVPPLSLLLSLPIDSLDLWLRRRTRDASWLRSEEGRVWLASEEGRAWRASGRDAEP